MPSIEISSQSTTSYLLIHEEAQPIFADMWGIETLCLASVLAGVTSGDYFWKCHIGSVQFLVSCMQILFHIYSSSETNFVNNTILPTEKVAQWTVINLESLLSMWVWETLTLVPRTVEGQPLTVAQPNPNETRKYSHEILSMLPYGPWASQLKYDYSNQLGMVVLLLDQLRNSDFTRFLQAQVFQVIEVNDADLQISDRVRCQNRHLMR